MNRKNMVLAIVLVLVIAGGLIWGLGRLKTVGVTQLDSPVQTPDLEETIEPLASPTGAVLTPIIEETPWSPDGPAPSDNWPTLTPAPTYPMVTPETVVEKEFPTLTPTPTLIPTPLPPIPGGQPPEDLMTILYLPVEDRLAINAVSVDAEGNRWSDPQVLYDFREVAAKPDYEYLSGFSVSPNGEWVAVYLAYFEMHKTWLLNTSSKALHRVPSIYEEYMGSSILDWHPNSEAILIELANQFGDSPDKFVLVNVLDDTVVDLKVPDTVWDMPHITSVKFSPDGGSIAWNIQNRGPEELTEVYLTDSMGGDSQLLLATEGCIWDMNWNPQGTQLAYSYNKSRGPVEVCVLDIETLESRTLVSNSGYTPIWSPDGQQIAFAVAMSEDPDKPAYALSVLNLNGESTIYPVTESPEGVYWDIGWSPDGKLLTYLDAGNPELQVIWVVSPETGEQHPISGYVKQYSDYFFVP